MAAQLPSIAVATAAAPAPPATAPLDTAPGTDPGSTDRVLCPHCLRTASNGIRCRGICVADADD
ncbi:hypothetical protein EVJ50_07805 [Synechococcus sp. RSCCF101]|uniref:hypothetical protein n=1 Tax=Synechococcus sp. RSCCF101 TaxID=2511069 RepID=UPI001248C8A1|nr:hypothetical protein [Synechococcus sp. RSCCF101]QEY32142.1 hypothetical protein EVJ50_07805 [Synechococcus sp. RSCCF101]